jgi:hypothetical protein
MNKILITTIFILGVLNWTSAAEMIYSSHSDNLSESQRKTSAASRRPWLFSDEKPTYYFQLQPMKNQRCRPFTINRAADGTFRLAPAKGKDYPVKCEGVVLMALPAASEKITIEISFKTNNFLKRQNQANFSIMMGDTRIWLKGNVKVLRFYDMTKKSYKNIIKLEENKFYHLKIDLRTGEKSSFDLSINNKKVLKDVATRGNIYKLNTLKMLVECVLKKASLNVPEIYLKDIKIYNDK